MSGARLNPPPMGRDHSLFPLHQPGKYHPTTV